MLTRSASSVKQLLSRYRNFSLSLILFLKSCIGIIHILKCKLRSVHILNMKKRVDGGGCY